MQKEAIMNIDDLYNDIEELEDENNPDNEELINSLSCLISAMDASAVGLISEKNFNKTCDNFRKDFPDYQFPNCIYFKGDSDE